MSEKEDSQAGPFSSGGEPQKHKKWVPKESTDSSWSSRSSSSDGGQDDGNQASPCRNPKHKNGCPKSCGSRRANQAKGSKRQNRGAKMGKTGNSELMGAVNTMYSQFAGERDAHKEIVGQLKSENADLKKTATESAAAKAVVDRITEGSAHIRAQMSRRFCVEWKDKPSLARWVYFAVFCIFVSLGLVDAICVHLVEILGESLSLPALVTLANQQLVFSVYSHFRLLVTLMAASPFAYFISDDWKLKLKWFSLFMVLLMVVRLFSGFHFTLLLLSAAALDLFMGWSTGRGSVMMSTCKHKYYTIGHPNILRYYETDGQDRCVPQGMLLHGDARPLIMSMAEAKLGPDYCHVEYERTRCWCQVEKRVKILISLELLYQLSSIDMMNSVDDPALLYRTMKYNIRSMYGVDIAKWLPSQGENVYQNTLDVAYGLVLQNRRKTEDLPRPNFGSTAILE